MAALAAKAVTPSSLPWYRDRDRWRTASFELGLTAGLMLIYFYLRGQRPDTSIEEAVSRSLAIVHFEQRIGIFTEVRWQSYFLPHDGLMFIANAVYAWGHYPVMLAIAVYLALNNPQHFRFVRNVLFVSAIMGILAYYILPAAPPRLMAIHGYDFGFVDTVHGGGTVSYFQPGPFVNHYAAVPSFHFGWIALCSAAIWMNTNRRSMKALAVAMSVIMWWAVTVTGNHYFFDMVMGGVVVAVSWLLVSSLPQIPWRRWISPSHEEQPVPQPRP